MVLSVPGEAGLWLGSIGTAVESLLEQTGT
jgi:hypothetical protein